MCGIVQLLFCGMEGGIGRWNGCSAGLDQRDEAVNRADRETLFDSAEPEHIDMIDRGE